MDGGLVGGSKQPWRWRGCGADGAGSQGVAVPQWWVQILAKLAKRLPSYVRGVGSWGRGRIYFYVAFSHFSLFTSQALEMASWKKKNFEEHSTILAFWSAICDLSLFTFGKHLKPPLIWKLQTHMKIANVHVGTIQLNVRVANWYENCKLIWEWVPAVILFLFLWAIVPDLDSLKIGSRIVFLNSLTAKSVLEGEKLIATYSIST